MIQTVSQITSIMIQTVSQILTLGNLNTEFLDRPDELLELPLKGSSSLSVDTNRLIIAAVMMYIGATGRFPVYC